MIGIHVHRRGVLGPYSKKFGEVLDYNGIPWKKLDINDSNFWGELKLCSHFIFHWGGTSDHYQLANTIMPIIESTMKISVFPNQLTVWHHDDKVRQYFLLKAHNYPIIDSYVFWERVPAIRWLKSGIKYPLIFKLKSSAGSQDVVKVNNIKEALRVTNRMFGKGIYLGHIPGNVKIKIIDFRLSKFLDKLMKRLYRITKRRDVNYQWQKEKNYVLFQKFLSGNAYDTRITIIGDRAFAFRRFNRDNDFRSSGSGKIDYDMTKINSDFLALAFSISKELGFQTMAYDFLWDEYNNPAICEISYTFQDLAIYNCPGYWDRNLKWHKGHFWPQYFQLMDLLKLPELKLPYNNIGNN